MEIWIVGAVLVCALLMSLVIFNQLVGLRQLAKNGWADIDVQLKRRADLIPKLVSTVKAYAKHETELFQSVVEKRNLALAAGTDPKSRSAAERALALPVSKLLAVAEDYPDLKANENFLELQNQLVETEDQLEMARRFYNGAVRGLNTKVQTIPANIIAGIFGFTTRDYFEADASTTQSSDVDFEV